jgi:spore coat protein JC
MTVGTEELGHLELVGTLVKQLGGDAAPDEWKKMNSWEYYADNGASVFPQSSQGMPFNAASVAVTGDPLTNLYEDLAAEQKVREELKNAISKNMRLR